MTIGDMFVIRRAPADAAAADARRVPDLDADLAQAVRRDLAARAR